MLRIIGYSGIALYAVFVGALIYAASHFVLKFW